jgi:hypothetical protein
VPNILFDFWSAGYCTPVDSGLAVSRFDFWKAGSLAQIRPKVRSPVSAIAADAMGVQAVSTSTIQVPTSTSNSFSYWYEGSLASVQLYPASRVFDLWRGGSIGAVAPLIAPLSSVTVSSFVNAGFSAAATATIFPGRSASANFSLSATPTYSVLNPVIASAAMSLSAAAVGFNTTRLAAASDSLSLSTSPFNFIPEQSFADRIRRGDKLRLKFILPGVPDTNPIVSMSRLGSTVEAFPMYSTDGITFFADLMPGAGYQLGIFTVTCSYSIAGQAGSQRGSIEIVGGGDTGGSVISMYSYQRPEANYVLAQLGNGALVQGRNPHL